MTPYIDIFAPDGSVIVSPLVTKEAKKVESLMGDDYIVLSWRDVKAKTLPVGAYIVYEGERYRLVDPYEPEQRSEAEWLYEPQFQSRVAAWSKVPCFFYTTGADGSITSREPDWTLTDNAANFIACIAGCIQRETGEKWTARAATDLAEYKTVQFSSTDIFSALNSIASMFETEWLADKTTNTLYLGKASTGNPEATRLEVGENVGVPSVTDSREGFYNRFYIFGSTRNITQDYHGANVNNLVNKRLTLDPTLFPGGFLDLRKSSSDPALSKILIFDDVYPKSNLVVMEARPRIMYTIDSSSESGDRIIIGTDAEGKPIYDTYAIWYVTLGVRNEQTGEVTQYFLPNTDLYSKDNPDGVLISGKTLSIHFSSGSLQGREFELAYHDQAETLVNSDGVPFDVKRGMFEIILTKEGDYVIPAQTGVVPIAGDKAILFNLRMPAEYVAGAYQELYKTAIKQIEVLTSDRNNYEFSSNPVAFSTDNPELAIGKGVTYINGSYTLETRVIALETQLDIPAEQRITIGNDIIKGNTQTLKEEVADAGKDISLLQSFNLLAQSTLDGYNRAIAAMQEGFSRISRMWQFDPDNPDCIYTPFNAYSQKGLAALGVPATEDAPGAGASLLSELNDVLLTSPKSGQVLTYNGTRWVNQTISSGGMDESALAAYLTTEGYLQGASLRTLTIQKNGTAVGTYRPDADKTINLTDVASASALTAHVGDNTRHITADERTKWNAAASNLSSILGSDASGVIDKWDEIVAFLATYTEADTLAGLLSNKADKAVKINAGAGLTGGGSLAADRTLSLASSGVTAGTYTKLTVDAYGRATAGSNPTTLAGYGITDAYTKTDADGRYVNVTGDTMTGSLTLPTIAGTNGQLNINNHLYTNAIELTPLEAYNNSVRLGKPSARWSNLYSVLGDFSGQVTAGSLKIGKCEITWDDSNKMLCFSKGAYSLEGISALGADATSTGGSTGGGGAVSFDRLDEWSAYSSDKAGYALSAKLGVDLNNRLGSALSRISLIEGDYVTRTTAQEIVGQKTFETGAWILKATESNEIKSVAYNNSTIAQGGVSSIRLGLDFRWYDTHWVIGNIRGGAANTDGFGIGLRNSEGKLDLGLRVTKSKVFSAGYATFGGTSSQFLKADGSVDSNSYLTTSSASSTYVKKAGDTITGALYQETASYISNNKSNRLVIGGGDDGYVWFDNRAADNTVRNNLCIYADYSRFSKYVQAPYFRATTNTLCENLNADLLDGWHATGNTGNAIKKSGQVNATVAGLSSYWCKLATITVANDSNNGDVTLYLHSAYNTRYGILALSARSSSTSPGYGARMLDGNIPAANIRFYRQSSTGTTYEVWVNVESQWGVINAVVLSETRRAAVESGGIVTLHSTTFTTAQTPTLSEYVNPQYLSLLNNVASATKLQTARTLWGQSFDGTGNVSGNLSSVGNITGSGAMIVKANGVLTLDGTQGIQIKYNNSDAGSVVLNSSGQFKPFDAANGKLTLGSTSARWSNLYSQAANFTDTITTSKTTNYYSSGNLGAAIINSTAGAGSYTMLAKMNSTNGVFTLGTYLKNFELHFAAKSLIDAGFNGTTHDIKLLDEDGLTTLKRLKIGDCTISYENGMLHISKGIYSDGDVTALGASQTSSGGSGSAGGGVDLLEAWNAYNSATGKQTALSAYLGYDLYQNKLSKTDAATIYQPKGNYLTAITKAQVEAVLTGNITSHTHQYITSSGALTAVSGTTVGSAGLRLYEAYNNGYPTTYGNLLRIVGTSHSGHGELLCGWTGDTSVGALYYRSKRDVAGTAWSDWAKLLTSSNTKIENGVITINGSTITPLTSHQSLANYVTLNTAQEIKAEKTFIANVIINHDKVLRFNSNTTSAKITMTNGSAIHQGADGANSSDANLRFGSWYGIGWYPTIANQTVPQGENAMWLNVRNGDLTVRGRFIKNGGTSSQVLMADGSVKAAHTLSTVANLGWGGTSGQLATINTIAYWNGCYSGTTSNLQYCDRGRFGTMVTTETNTYQTVGWYSLTTYIYDATNGTRYYWHKIASIATGAGSGHAMLEIIAQDDSNFPSIHNLKLSLSCYNNGTTKSAALSGMPRLRGDVDVMMTTGGDVWIRFRNITWTSYAKFRLISGAFSGNGITIYTAPTKQEAKPAGSTEITDGGGIKLSGTSFEYYPTSIQANASSATKLNATRKLWGQNFNGEADVSGNMTGVGSIQLATNGLGLIGTRTDGTRGSILYFSSANTLRLNYDFRAQDWITYYGGAHVWYKGDTEIMRVHTDGNVGIGTTSPAYKLDVSGSARATTSLITPLLSGAGNLTIRGGNEIYLQYGNTEAKSLRLVDGLFAPYASGNNKISLGVASARWSNVYSVLGNFSGLITATAGIKIGEATLSWDASHNALKCDKNFYSTANVAALGADTTTAATTSSSASGSYVKKSTMFTGTSVTTEELRKRIAADGWYVNGNVTLTLPINEAIEIWIWNNSNDGAKLTVNGQARTLTDESYIKLAISNYDGSLYFKTLV
ncbi:MAG: hypothetical protein K2G35_08675 [Duncaniella sp.]|nr:hypothetical protein [Duncaniella sp.]